MVVKIVRSGHLASPIAPVAGTVSAWTKCSPSTRPRSRKDRETAINSKGFASNL